VTRLVIFDCDGVLIDSEPIACAIMSAVLTENGFPLTEDDIHGFIGQSGKDTQAAVEKRFGKPFPADIRQRFHDAYRRRLDADAMPAIKGVAELIDALATPACVASNSSHDYLRMVLGSAQLIARFPERLFSSYDVARPKPHPDLFEHAARTLGGLAHDCIVIEDSVHGVTAGVAAGMRVIGFCGGGHCRPGHNERLIAVGAETVCADMNEVARHLGIHGYLK
jgi:HAD superfamily hydrolase (TIGR01509 family)